MFQTVTAIHLLTTFLLFFLLRIFAIPLEGGFVGGLLQLLNIVWYVLTFPIQWLDGKTLTDLTQLRRLPMAGLLIGNSIVWGLGLTLVWKGIARLVGRRLSA